MKTSKIISLFIVSLFVYLPTLLTAQAQVGVTPTNRLQNTAAAANLSTTSVTPQSVIVDIILIVFGLIGLIFLCLIIYSGFIWMTSQGDKAKIEKAKTTISNSVIGFAIIVASYAIVDFISKTVLNSIQDRFMQF